MADKITAPSIYAMKHSGKPIACITAYDSTSAMIADESGADLILVGDSAGNTMLGYSTTLFVDLADMVRFTSAAARTVKRALLVADLPFGSYQTSIEQAVESSVALMKAGAEAVKLEGDYGEAIAAIRHAGIPVMGHVGMTPQSVHSFGGHKVQGRKDGDAILAAAKSVDQAGAFAIVIELTPAELAKRITDSVGCPTIGIGAGPDCDGQVQVFHDVVGLTPQTFKHAKRYADGLEAFRTALATYVGEVRSGAFPTGENSF